MSAPAARSDVLPEAEHRGLRLRRISADLPVYQVCLNRRPTCMTNGFRLGARAELAPSETCVMLASRTLAASFVKQLGRPQETTPGQLICSATADGCRNWLKARSIQGWTCDPVRAKCQTLAWKRPHAGADMCGLGVGMRHNRQQHTLAIRTR